MLIFNYGGEKMTSLNIIRTENKIQVQKMVRATTLSKEYSLMTIASYDLNNKVGTISQFEFTAPKVYKSLSNWKKAVQRIFDITVD